MNSMRYLNISHGLVATYTSSHGVYASMTGQFTGVLTSDIGAQVIVFSYANFGLGSYTNSDLQIGNSEQGTIFVDEEFTMNATVV